MVLSVSSGLVDLAELFEKKHTSLYIVGGYVRSGFMGLGREDDIDLASSMRPDRVIELLKGTQFEVKIKNQRTGVLEILVDGSWVEHATFRTEHYAVSGEHMPTEVQFIESLEQDADRRDFTCNALYYEILSGQVEDPLGGLADIKNGVLRAVGSPRVLFQNDAERILRMVRQASMCGFHIDQKTFEGAKRNVFRLKFLSTGRLKKEWNKMLKADVLCPGLGLRAAHVRAVKLMEELGALEYISPELAQLFQTNPKLKNGLGIREATYNALLFAPQGVRSAVLFAGLGALTFQKRGKVKKGYQEEGAELAQIFMQRLDMSKEQCQLSVLAAKYHFLITQGAFSLSKARQVVLEARMLSEEFAEVCLALQSGAKQRRCSSSRSYANLLLASKQAKSGMFATQINQLRINIDAEKLGLSPKEVAAVKQGVLFYGAKKGKFLTEKQKERQTRAEIKKIFVQVAQK